MIDTACHLLIISALGYNVGIISAGIGSPSPTNHARQGYLRLIHLSLSRSFALAFYFPNSVTTSLCVLRYELMSQIYDCIKAHYKNVTSSGYTVQFAFAFLGLSDAGIIDYTTLESIPSDMLVKDDIGLEDLLIEAEATEDISIMDQFVNSNGSLLASGLFFNFRIESCLEESDEPALHCSLCVADLGLFESSLSSNASHGNAVLTNSLKSIKDIGLLLNQPFLATSIPYEQNHITKLLAEYIGGNAQTCLVLHVDACEVSESTFSGLQFGEILRNIKNRPIINEEDPRFKELEALEQLKESHAHLTAASSKRYSALQSCFEQVKSVCTNLESELAESRSEATGLSLQSDYDQKVSQVKSLELLDDLRKLEIKNGKHNDRHDETICSVDAWACSLAYIYAHVISDS